MPGMGFLLVGAALVLALLIGIPILLFKLGQRVGKAEGRVQGRDDGAPKPTQKQP